MPRAGMTLSRSATATPTTGTLLLPRMEESKRVRQWQEDDTGGMWLAVRHGTYRQPREDGWAIQGRWDVYATAYLGDRWLAPVELPGSGGRNDMRTTSQRDEDGN